MPEPIREQALAAVAAALATMTGERLWGGTYPSAVTVDRAFKMTAQIRKYPYLIVIEGPGSSVSGPELRGSVAAITHQFQVAIYGYVHADSNVSASTWLQRLWDDVFQTMLNNSTFGGTIRTIWPSGGGEHDEGELEPEGAFFMPWTAVLDEEKTWN